MKLTLMIALLAAMLAAGWGIVAGNSKPPTRMAETPQAVTGQWYASLPRDASVATAAYVARIPQAMIERGEAMNRTRYWVLAARIIGTLAAGALVLFSGAAARLAAALRSRISRVWLCDLLFALGLLMFFFVILLPIDVYAGFVRARQFGFSEQPFASWLRDVALNTAVLALFEAVGIVAIVALIRRRPRSWVPLAAAVYFALSGAYVLLTPVAIEPMFNSYTPVPDSALKRQILSLAQANGVATENVYVDDASRQTRLLNAHVSGIGGTARIALDDNLLADPFTPSVLFVVAHEIGHYVHRDMLVSIVFETLVAGLAFLFIALAGAVALRLKGSRWGIAALSDTAAISLIWTGYLLFGLLALPAENAFYRWQETRADSFGLEASRQPNGMAEFMVHDPDNASIDPPALDLALFYDHPSHQSRIEAAMRWREAHAARLN